MKEDIIAMARRAGAHDDGNEVRFVELRYLERFAALVAAAERKMLMQLFTDPENQPTQHGTVTMEYMQQEIAAEREACAKMVGDFAKKWWSIHCASNKHMETTRKAHDDFCALQVAIRARGENAA